MADFVASLGHALDTLMSYLGVRGVNGLEAVYYILGATISLGLCAAVRSAIRIAFLSCSTRR
ncbi:MAG: hypothetical protein WB579_01470 [Bryobacteraceae bacterium]